MEGDGLLHPRGPLPPAIYWRRRLAVVFGVLVLIFLAAKCAPGGGKKTPSKSSSSSTPKASGKSSSSPAPKSSSPAPSKSASTPASTPASSKPASSAPVSPAASSSAPAAPAECKAPALQVSVKANASTYAAGVNPVITMTIKNAGTAPCTRDIGAAATELKITSGSDRIWSSDDCNKGGKPAVTLLKPGDVKTVVVTWNRKRSKPAAVCIGADALSGLYKVEGRLGNLITVRDTFFLS